ncbi:hypothetical protein FKM82_007086 [Ascaphus truei]
MCSMVPPGTPHLRRVAGTPAPCQAVAGAIAAPGSISDRAPPSCERLRMRGARFQSRRPLHLAQESVGRQEGHQEVANAQLGRCGGHYRFAQAPWRVAAAIIVRTRGPNVKEGHKGLQFPAASGDCPFTLVTGSQTANRACNFSCWRRMHCCVQSQEADCEAHESVRLRRQWGKEGGQRAASFSPRPEIPRLEQRP